jgi:UDP-N-acetylmuramate dehydrogenase
MLNLQENISLKSLNTFGFEANADYFTSLSSVDEVEEIIKSGRLKKNRFLVLGGGSNVLFTGDFKGIVLKSDIQGIEVVNENSEYAEVRCGAGVNWDGFVEWAVERNLGGIENLSMIPGTVGASPIQNIGAYGSEAKDTLSTVEGFMIEDHQPFLINNFDCEFGYRTSIFKTKLWNKSIITYVTFRLNKNPEFKTNYGNVLYEVEKLGKLNLKNIRQAIINIRTAKLPDPLVLGNAGSFFKNPVIGTGKAKRIQETYPDIPLFKVNNNYKVSAAYLIDKCGWKGFRNGQAGVHDKQPLVLVNYGNAKGIEILDLAHKIQESIRKTFEIDLEMEVNVIA